MISTDLITIDPDILGGTPVFKGTRVPVKTLFDYLENNVPEGRDAVVLNWGDARPSNILVRDFVPVDEAVKGADWSRFAALPAFEAAHRINAYGTYLQMEREALAAPR